MYNILKIIINVTTEINLEITNFRSSAVKNILYDMLIKLRSVKYIPRIYKLILQFRKLYESKRYILYLLHKTFVMLRDMQ